MHEIMIGNGNEAHRKNKESEEWRRGSGLKDRNDVIMTVKFGRPQLVKEMSFSSCLVRSKQNLISVFFLDKVLVNGFVYALIYTEPTMT